MQARPFPNRLAVQRERFAGYYRRQGCVILENERHRSTALLEELTNLISKHRFILMLHNHDPAAFG
jgi:hypothetical protein